VSFPLPVQRKKGVTRKWDKQGRVWEYTDEFELVPGTERVSYSVGEEEAEWCEDLKL
jgi:hypothetical protein